MPQCKAKSKRSGERCRRAAITGKEVCYIHGGMSTGPKNPHITHGLYSKHVPADWLNDYEYFKSDPNLTDLTADIAIARTVRARFFKNMETVKNLSAEMIEAMIEHGIKIAKMCETQHKIKNGETTTIKIDEAYNFVDRVIDHTSAVIDMLVTDLNLATKVKVAIAERLKPKQAENDRS